MAVGALVAWSGVRAHGTGAHGTGPMAGAIAGDGLPYSRDYHVFEFRRYTIKPGQRDNFARYFDTLFPEAFQQLGALAIGQFLERDHPDGFTWIRGFKTIEDRAIVNSAFYFGPVWKEHKTTLNGILDDSDNVLLLTPLDDRGVAVLPAVDAVRDATGERGRVLAQIYRVSAGRSAEFAARAAASFAKYRAAGAREAAVLITLDVPNNFPALPIRTDGPYLMWLGVIPNDAALESKIETLMNQSGRELVATGLLQSDPETVVMTPTGRSRLRWR
jgi:hypothetical protein